LDHRFNFSHKKEKLIVDRIERKIVFFKYLLKDVQYYISGSFLMNLTFAQKEKYSDIDLYFPDKDNYFKAVKILNNSEDFAIKFASKYAITYTSINQVDLQLVKTSVSNIYKLANQHDFANCCLAYEPNRMFYYCTVKAFNAWAHGVLDPNKTPLLNFNYPPHLFLNQLKLFYSRLKKYTSRYNLILSQNIINTIKKIKKLHLLHLNFYEEKNYLYDYAGSRVICIISSTLLSDYLSRIIDEKSMFKLPVL
jgi:hypothetical protein